MRFANGITSIVIATVGTLASTPAIADDFYAGKAISMSTTPPQVAVTIPICASWRGI